MSRVTGPGIGVDVVLVPFRTPASGPSAPPALCDLGGAPHLQDPSPLPIAPSSVSNTEVEERADDGEGDENNGPPPEKLVPWNSTMWNPEDSVEDVSMLPEPTTGVGGEAGVLLPVPIVLQVLHLSAGTEILNC